MHAKYSFCLLVLFFSPFVSDILLWLGFGLISNEIMLAFKLGFHSHLLGLFLMMWALIK